MYKLRNSASGAAVALCLFATSFSTHANSDSSVTGPMVAPEPYFAMPGPDLDIDPKQFGVQDSIIQWVGSPEFASRDGAPIGADGGAGGYIHNAGGSASDIFWAQIHLPQGALLSGMRLFYCDTNASGNPTTFITVYEGTGLSDLTSDTPAATTPGCTSEFFVTNLTIDHNPVGGEERFYVFNTRLNASDNTVRFKGYRMLWKRQVSPAPGVATFGDVPTGHTFFQSVEALADSGITGGCGGGNYCPNDVVTRGQMAAFLARALGLHWGL